MIKMIMVALLALTSVVFADELIGYDGECAVYFRPDYGFVEICQENQPIFIGESFDTIQFRHGHFKANPGFQKERFQVTHKETQTIHQKGRIRKD